MRLGVKMMGHGRCVRRKRTTQPPLRSTTWSSALGGAPCPLWHRPTATTIPSGTTTTASSSLPTTARPRQIQSKIRRGRGRRPTRGSIPSGRPRCRATGPSSRTSMRSCAPGFTNHQPHNNSTSAPGPRLLSSLSLSLWLSARMCVCVCVCVWRAPPGARGGRERGKK